MQQYQVPQFITIEDKVIGNLLTIKQSLYIGGGAVLAFVAYRFFQFYIFIPLAILFGGLAAALAFWKINEQPFPIILKRAFFFFVRPRLYVWQKRVPQAAKKAPTVPDVLVHDVPKIARSKLSDLAWSLDIKMSEQNQEKE